MTPEEFIREFEKTPKKLMQTKPNVLLFEEDYPEGRMTFVCAAMNGEENKIQNAIEKILVNEDGPRHLVRTLNNIKTIGHAGTLCFAKPIFESLEKSWDTPTRLVKLIQLLDAVSPDLRTGIGWLGDAAARCLDENTLSSEDALNLWMHWCAAILRSSFAPTPLIEQLAPRRPLKLQKTQINAIKDSVSDAKVSWDMQSAAIYLLLGNQLISLERAQNFVETAYASFPLESLEGVEILALAIENDATAFAEFDVIQDKLAQIRKENLYLRDMSQKTFVEASISVFEDLEAVPQTPLEIALCLQNQNKNERLILTAFIDDARRADWFYMARKSTSLRSLCALFFDHFTPENPVIRAFSADLVMALVDNHNADAMSAETWQTAIENDQFDVLADEAPKWAEFCKA